MYISLYMLGAVHTGFGSALDVFPVVPIYFCVAPSLLPSAAYCVILWLLPCVNFSGRHDVATQGQIPSEFIDRSGMCCCRETQAVGAGMAWLIVWAGTGNTCGLLSSWFLYEEIYAWSQGVVT